MLLPLLLQVAPVVLESDRVAFEEYRQCVLAKVREATSENARASIHPHSKNGPCQNLRVAAALEMSADDMEKTADAFDAGHPEPAYAKVAARLAIMDRELAAEVAAIKTSEPSNAPD